MAPEEFEKGRLIDERTTVFALGRTMTIFLGALASKVARRAGADEPGQRHASVAELADDFTAMQHDFAAMQHDFAATVTP